jgi:hypothetical protein
VTRKIGRRDALKGVGTAALVGIAGCSGGGNGDDDNETGSNATGDANSSDTSSGEATPNESTGGSADAFEYTFGSNDDAVGSSLTGIRVNYPDGTGAVSDATVASVTLGEQDVSDDLDSTSTSNNGTSLRLDFGGDYDVSADDTLALELADVSEPEGTYTVEVVVNPQSGGTSFETSF